MKNVSFLLVIALMLGGCVSGPQFARSKPDIVPMVDEETIRFTATLHDAEYMNLYGNASRVSRAFYEVEKLQDPNGYEAIVVGKDAHWAVTMTIEAKDQPDAFPAVGSDYRFVVHDPRAAFGQLAMEIDDLTLDLVLQARYYADDTVEFTSLERYVEEEEEQRVGVFLSTEAPEEELEEEGEALEEEEPAEPEEVEILQ